MSTENRFAPPKNYTDNKKLALEGDRWSQDSWEKPVMRFRVVNGNIRLTVYMNRPNEKDNSGPIHVKMDAVIANILLRRIEEVAEGSEDVDIVGIENLNYDWTGGVRSENIQPMGKVYVAKDKEGVIGLKVEGKNKKDAATFRFLPNRFYRLVDRTGTPLSKRQTSRLIAMAWVNTLRMVVGPLLIDTEPKEDAKGGQKPSNYRSQPRQSASRERGESFATADSTDVFDDI